MLFKNLISATITAKQFRCDCYRSVLSGILIWLSNAHSRLSYDSTGGSSVAVEV